MIAGSFGGRFLRTVRGKGTRPTGDRVRESLFGILGPSVRGSRFLDLFAGTGAVGIEALSRGAERAVFVESARSAGRTLRQNLADLEIEMTGWETGGGAVLLTRDVFAALDRVLGRFGPFDLVFIDPPYAKEWGARTLGALARQPAHFSPGARAVLQHGRREGVPDEQGAWCRFRVEAYGETHLSFYRWTRG